MRKNTGKTIFLGGLVGIVFGVAWDQLTSMPYLVRGLGIASLILGIVLWCKSRQKELLITKTSMEPITEGMAYACWGISLMALAVSLVCRYVAGFSVVGMLPEHLQDSQAIKIIFLIGLGWTALAVCFFIHFCWLACRALRVTGRVTGRDTQIQDGSEIYAEVVSYYMSDKVRQVVGRVWTPIEPTLGKTRIVWVSRDNWDKAVFYSPLMFVIFGIFGVLGVLVLGFIFYVA